MFATFPVLNTANQSESRIIQLTHIEEIAPHADVTVNPSDPEGELLVPSSEAKFFSGRTLVILIPLAELKNQLQALTGTMDEYGSIS